jgi:adenylosuccinate synthase
VRFLELVDEKALRKKLEEVLPMKLSILKNAYGVDVDFDLESIVAEYSALGKKLKPYFGDVSAEIYNALNSNKNVLFEGAQGTFLDNDFGTYPYVTSSHPLAGGVFCGVGIGPANLSRIIGIAKAYTTRVGEGPFPAELFDSVGETMRKVGAEFGTTTGRPRRVGWLDLNILRTAKRLNGFNEIAITKLDVLCGLEKLLVGVAYNIDGAETKDVPVSLDEVARAKVVYKEFKGFNFEPDKVKTFADLPKEAQDYIIFIEKEVGVKASIISVGPSREQTIVR